MATDPSGKVIFFALAFAVVGATFLNTDSGANAVTKAVDYVSGERFSSWTSSIGKPSKDWYARFANDLDARREPLIGDWNQGANAVGAIRLPKELNLAPELRTARNASTYSIWNDVVGPRFGRYVGKVFAGFVIFDGAWIMLYAVPTSIITASIADSPKGRAEAGEVKNDVKLALENNWQADLKGPGKKLFGEWAKDAWDVHKVFEDPFKLKERQGDTVASKEAFS